MKEWISILCATAFLVVSGASSAENTFDVEKVESLAKSGITVAQTILGDMYLQGQGVRQDYSQARHWFELAAQQGFADAQLNLAGMYYRGEGVSQDYIQAKHWLELAAKQGLIEAQFILGGMYHLGQSVRQDFVQAKEWFGKACDNGNQNGCDFYRKINETGIR